MIGGALYQRRLTIEHPSGIGIVPGVDPGSEIDTGHRYSLRIPYERASRIVDRHRRRKET